MYGLARTVYGSCFKAVKSFRKLRFLSIAALLVAALLPSLVAVPASANPGLTVSNALILTDVKPGQTLTQTMTVKIASSDPATDISVKVTGVAQSLQGGYELLDAVQDTGPYSARTFVSVDKSSFHLDPGGSQDVTATIQVPQDVGDGGRYAIINFATQPTAGSGVSIITAVDVPVYLTVAGSKIVQTGKITGVSTNEITSGQPIDILTDFQNTGNHHFKVQGQVIVKDAGGQTIDTVSMPLTSSSILPGMTRQLEAPLDVKDALAAGTYSIDSRVTLDDGTVLDESTGTFELKTQYEPQIAGSSTTPSGASAPAAQASSGTSSGGNTLYAPSSAVASIDLTPSSASTLKNGDGSISIDFPAGAAVTPVKVSLESYSIDKIPAAPSGMALASTCFRVEGLTGLLAKNAVLTVKYSMVDLDKAGGNADRLRLARWNEGTSQWAVLNTSVNTGANSLVASSNQMGVWAVIIGPPTSPGLNWTIIGSIIAVIVVLCAAIVFIMSRRRGQTGPAG